RALDVLIYQKIYNSFLFHYDADYNQIKEWYPRFHIFIYSFTIITKFFFYLASVAFIVTISLLIVKKRSKILAWLRYNYNNLGYAYLNLEIKILFCLLLSYLVIFWVTKLNHFDNFFYLQRTLARSYLISFLFQISILIVHHYKEVFTLIKKFLLRPESPYPLAIFRILFFAYLIFVYFTKYTIISPLLKSSAAKYPLPYISWLIQILPLNITVYNAIWLLGIIVCVLIIIGFQTRWCLWLNAVLCFYLVATPNFFGKLWHDHFPIWISWFFALSRCYHVFSVDALRKKFPVYKSSSYGWPIKLVWLQFGIIYFWAGFYKLWDSGFEWALGENMINQIRLEWVQHYDKIPSIRIDKCPLLLHIGGLIVIHFEMLYFFLLFNPSTRAIAAIGGLIMHNIIGYIMYINFFYGLQVYYVFYLNLSKLFSQKTSSSESPARPSIALFCAGLILVINFICGMFSISTYPFSAFPKYSALIDNTFKIVEFRCSNFPESANEIARKQGFYWEDYGWVEHNLIKDYDSGINIKKRIFDYWKIWISRVPQLKTCDTVYIYVKQRSLIPEEKDIFFNFRKIGFIKDEKVELFGQKKH
ncbi:MAG: hypothetical protein NZ522_04795, partial [Chitinophagales bacterium]|nr:hypothetical protein [Chitinophagales bacterium]